MIIDNKQSYGSNENIRTVWDCIFDYSNPGKGREGKMDIVTGFFSIAALHILHIALSKNTKYRIVLGDIHDMARDEDFLKKAVNLLQGDSALESAFQLSTYAKNAIAFLRRNTVEVKTINNAFCHAKSYVFEDKDDPAHDYGIVGSSNLTEAGLGIKESSNVELNLVETGRENAAVKDLKRWFENQWNTVASAKIAIPIENGKTIEKDAKSYLIERIEQIFKAYTPEEIYQKILFEFFRADIEMNDSIEYRREMEFLQKSRIWNTLFKFQQSGVVSLVKLLTRYGGAIMADAVGLGKTFSALGVIKYFQNNGYHTLILCPKKLRNNWTRYNVNAQSRFEEDHFTYVVRCHTDLQDNRIDNNNYKDNITKDTILDYEKLLVVVDESHNLRNDKSSRYKMLLDEIISESASRGHTVKVLLLSATPINTGLKDIRNQFKMIGYDGNDHFYDEFNLRGVDPLYEIFRQANNQYTLWAEEPNHTVNTLRSRLSNVPNFFKLTDELIIARNRAFVTSYESSLSFPTQLKPHNEHISLKRIGAYADMDAIYDDLKILRLTAYQPTQYEYELYSDIVDRAAEIVSLVQQELPLDNNDMDERALYNALRRVKGESRSEILQQMIAQNWVVKQSIRRFNAGRINWDNSALRELSLAGMMISLFVKRLESCWDSCLKTITKVRDLHVKWLDLAEQRSNAELDDEDDTTQEEDIETIGKRTVDFAKMLRVEDYIKDLQRDIDILDRIISNLQQYGDDIAASRRRDEKLDTLVSILKNKQECSNKKVVIFTSYTVTANYIFSNIKGILPNVDLVTGDITQTELEGKLQRFAPYSKLYKEMRWDTLYADAGINPDEIGDTELYTRWRELVKNSKNNKARNSLENPIDILVATDCISEGQNLQDADMVINYDIHWNPVRLIQRFGRIDRIGSPNAKIQSVNFWPSEDIEAYLGLSDRVSNRMVAMNVAGSETLQANEDIAEMEKNNQFRQSQDAKSLRSIHDDQVGEIEDLGNPTFDVLSLSEFKADAEEYAQKHLKELERMPNGAFSGFRWKMQPYADYPECLVVLLRHREDTKSFHLLCIPVDATSQATFRELDKAEVLNLLSIHKKEQTYLPQDIMCANPNILNHLANIIINWFKPKKGQAVVDAVLDILDGNDNVVEGSPEERIEDTIDISKYDLIAWDYTSKKEQ